MSLARIVIAATFALLAGCQTAKFAGPAIQLPPDLAGDARIAQRDMLVDASYLSSSDPDREDKVREFTDSLQSELRDQLGRCANGRRKLILDTYITGVRTLSPLMRKPRRGEHQMQVIAVLTDPETKQIVGRYPMDIAVDTGNLVLTLLSDRASMLGEAYGQELCRTLQLARTP